MRKNHQKLFEDIYDILKSCGMPKKQNDEWAKLQRKFEKEARKEFGNFVRYKNCEWDGDRNIISFGKYFKIKLLKGGGKNGI